MIVQCPLPRAEPMMPAVRRVVIAIALLGTCIYLILAWLADADRLRLALQQLGYTGCAMILSLSLVNYLLRFQRWQYYLVRFGHRFACGQQLLYYLSGFAFTLSPAKAGEAIRSVYLRAHGVTYVSSIAALFVERLIDVLVMALLAALIVFDRPAYRPVVIGSLVCAVLVLILMGSAGAPRWVRLLSERYQGRAAVVLGGLSAALGSSRHLLRPRSLFVGGLLGMAAWGAEGIGFYLICQGLQLPIDVVVAVGIYALAAIAGSAALFMPAGIGGMEIVMTTLLIAHGVPLRIALVATILCRLTTLWFAVLIGIGAAILVEVRVRARLSVTP